MVVRISAFSMRASPSRALASVASLLAVIALTSGCVGDAHAHDATLIQFKVVEDAAGLRFEASSTGPFPTDAQITIKAVGPSISPVDDAFRADELVPGPNGSFRVPVVYPVEGGMGFDVEALVDGTQVGGREFVIRDLGLDELPGLRERDLGAIYSMWFRKTSVDHNGSESQRGSEAVAIDPNGRPARLFSGTGSLTKALGPVVVSINLTKIERTAVLGRLTDEEKIGTGTWSALAPATGNGTVVSYRQDVAGYETVALGNGTPKEYAKQVTTATLRGVFGSGDETKPLEVTVFWTEWVDVDTGRVAWMRQRPASLDDPDPATSAQGPPRSDNGLAIPPWTLRGKIPVPAHEGDEFPLDLGGGRGLVVRVSPETTTQVMGRASLSRVWTSLSDDYIFSMQASADPAVAGLPLIWEFREESEHGTWSVSNVLGSLKNNR